MLTQYSKTITIPESVIDGHGHVNNVAYVRWMQDIAVEHYAALGGMEAQQLFGTWFVRKHEVEYLLPGKLGDRVEIRTWVENLQRVRSLRKYEFIRVEDGKTLARGETEWVFVDGNTGKPAAIPAEVRAIFSR